MRLGNVRAGLLRHRHRTTTDYGTTAGASAKFGKGHFHRHNIVPVIWPVHRAGSDHIAPGSSCAFVHRQKQGCNPVNL